MEIKIDSGIPVTGGVGRPPGGIAPWRSWPFAALEIGQSFYVPVDPENKQLRRRLQCLPSEVRKARGPAQGRQFVARWRTAAQELADGQPDRGCGVRFFRVA